MILIEADLRRPALGRGPRRRARASGGVVSVLIENVRPRGRADHRARPTATTSRLLLADYEGGWIAELFSIPAAQQMIEDARQLADYVIIDSPAAERGRRRAAAGPLAPTTS